MLPASCLSWVGFYTLPLPPKWPFIGYLPSISTIPKWGFELDCSKESPVLTFNIATIKKQVNQFPLFSFMDADTRTVSPHTSHTDTHTYQCTTIIPTPHSCFRAHRRARYLTHELVHLALINTKIARIVCSIFICCFHSFIPLMQIVENSRKPHVKGHMPAGWVMPAMAPEHHRGNGGHWLLGLEHDCSAWEPSREGHLPQ